MRVLVWQWGRHGAGPRVATELAAGFSRLDGVTALLSLAEGAEILTGPAPPRCDLPVRTYDSVRGFVGRLAATPATLPRLVARLRAMAPDLALCAMPGPLDLLMGVALRRVGVPYAVVVHDADPHPGDGFLLQMTLQRRLLAHADDLVALSGHVADRLRQQDSGRRAPIRATLPPFVFGPPPPPPRCHDGPLRLLSFGRLLPYKGLDLLADGLARLGPRDDLEVRVVGQGPDSAALAQLRALPGVRVENRWVPESEIGALLAWSDALVLSHREASQSGVAAAAIAARRWVVATRVGGIVEQLRHEPLALLCEPDAGSIADAILALLARATPDAGAEHDPYAVWNDTAAALLGQLGTRLRPGGGAKRK